MGGARAPGTAESCASYTYFLHLRDFPSHPCSPMLGQGRRIGLHGFFSFSQPPLPITKLLWHATATRSTINATSPTVSMSTSNRRILRRQDGTSRHGPTTAKPAPRLIKLRQASNCKYFQSSSIIAQRVQCGTKSCRCTSVWMMRQRARISHHRSPRAQAAGTVVLPPCALSAGRRPESKGRDCERPSRDMALRLRGLLPLRSARTDFPPPFALGAGRRNVSYHRSP